MTDSNFKEFKENITYALVMPEGTEISCTFGNKAALVSVLPNKWGVSINVDGRNYTWTFFPRDWPIERHLELFYSYMKDDVYFDDTDLGSW